MTIPLTVSLLLIGAAFLCTLASLTTPNPRVPLWVSVLLIEVLLLLTVLPK